MPCKTCSPLPLTDLSRFRSSMSRTEKVKQSAELINAAPELLREQMIASIEKHENLIQLINDSSDMQQEVCGHAALAAMIDPSLRLQYAVALYKTDEIHHLLVLSTLLYSHSQRDMLELFLMEIDAAGFESAAVKMIDSFQNGIFPRASVPAQSAGEQSALVSEYLFEVALHSSNANNRLIAVNWLPYYCSSSESCITLLKQLLKQRDVNVRGMAALQISLLCPDYPDLRSMLWQPVQDDAPLSRQFVEFNGERGPLQKLLLQRLVELRPVIKEVPPPGEEKGDIDNTSRKCARFWLNQMELTCRVDRAAFEKSVENLYSSVLLPPPPAVLWFESPRAAAVAATLYFQWKYKERPKFVLEAVSRPTQYIDKLVEIIERFPDFHPSSIGDWNFGRKRWRVMPEWEPAGWFTCGTALLRLPPERGRHLWDSVMTNGILSNMSNQMSDELTLVARQLQKELGFTLSAINPDFDFDGAVNTAMYDLLNHFRLRMVGYTAFLKQLQICPPSTDNLEELMQHCPTFIAFDDVVFACERPTHIRRNARGQLHHESGPSIEYADGWGAYQINGISLKPGIVNQPQHLCAKEICKTWNVEQRRIMLERLGIENFLNRCDAEIINEDEFGILYRVPIESEPFNIVHVKNKSPEPDGSYRNYFLRVPPDMATAREAVAWSFGMTATEYDPEIET